MLVYERQYMHISVRSLEPFIGDQEDCGLTRRLFLNDSNGGTFFASKIDLLNTFVSFVHWIIKKMESL